MTESAILWLFGTVIMVQVVVIGALGKALWDHVGACKTVHENLASIGGELEHISREIGGYESGIRGQQQKNVAAISELTTRVAVIEGRKP